MPTAELSRRRRDAPEPSRTRAAENDQFDFPTNHHLLVTTASHVLCWNREGLRPIFKSGSAGIAAARESRDGSRKLAVADGRNVLMHEVERGMEGTYRLKGAEGQVRLLEFAPDSKTLFFSTDLSNAVQLYGPQEARSLDPLHPHPSTPTVFAISPTGHLSVSASQRPVSIHLENVALRTAPTVLKPRASDSAVAVAAFHPKRPNIFLLGFEDGTVAAYSAAIQSRGTNAGRTRKHVSDGEIGHLKGLFSSVPNLANNATGTAQKMSIVGAAFLPGYRSRAVCVGFNGRAKLVDFAEEGKVLRTWHVRGLATSLDVLLLKSPVQDQDAGSEQTIIAFGLSDGKVMLYDSIGLLLCSKTTTANTGHVIDVRWMEGAGPASFKSSDLVRFSEDDAVDLPDLKDHRTREEKSFSSRKRPSLEMDTEQRAPNPILSRFERLKRARLNPAEPGQASSNRTDSGRMRRVIVPPQDGPASREDTVRRHGEKKSAAPVTVAGAPYMDLFSPMKPALTPLKPRPQAALSTSRSRTRPRISSSTFIDTKRQVAPSRRILQDRTSISDVPIMSPSRNPPRTQPMDIQPSEPPPGKVTLKVPEVEANHLVVRDLNSTSRQRDRTKDAAILSDLTKFGGKKGQKGFALFAPYMPKRQQQPGATQPMPVTNKMHESASIETSSDLRSSDLSIDDSLGNDIWITSDSDSDTRRFTRRMTRRNLKEQDAAPESQAAVRVGPGRFRPMQYRRGADRSSLTVSTAGISNAQTGSSSSSRSSVSLAARSSFEADENDTTITATEAYRTAPQIPSASETSLVPLSADVPDGLPIAEGSPKKKARFKNRRPSMAAELPPGAADSPEGPVTVGRYFPRRSSLANLEKEYSQSSTTDTTRHVNDAVAVAQRPRTALNEVSGNGREYRPDPDTTMELQPYPTPRNTVGMTLANVDIWDDAKNSQNTESPQKPSSTATGYHVKPPPLFSADVGRVQPARAASSERNPAKPAMQRTAEDSSHPNACACGGACCGELRLEVQKLKDELTMMRELMKGVISTTPRRRR